MNFSPTNEWLLNNWYSIFNRRGGDYVQISHCLSNTVKYLDTTTTERVATDILLHRDPNYRDERVFGARVRLKFYYLVVVVCSVVVPSVGLYFAPRRAFMVLVGCCSSFAFMGCMGLFCAFCGVCLLWEGFGL